MNEDIQREVSHNEIKGQRIKAYCQRCDKSNHEIIQSYHVDTTVREDENFWTHDKDAYSIIECLGCNEVSFLHKNWCSLLEGWGFDGFTLKQYPHREAKTRVKKRYNTVPKKIGEMYFGSVDCFNADHLVLCAGGLRAVLEGVCVYKNIKGGLVPDTNGKLHPDGTPVTRRKDTFEGRIYGLFQEGLLTQAQADLLHKPRLMGNDAMHELEAPSPFELNLTIDIVEHILDTLFEIPHKGKMLKEGKSSAPLAFLFD